MEQSSHKGASVIKAIIIIAVLGAVVAGLYFLFIDAYISRTAQFKLNDIFSSSSIPEELSGAHYLLTPLNGGGIYTPEGLVYADYVTDGSLVLDYAEAGDTTSRLVYSPSTQMYEIRIGESVFLASELAKKSLFLSEDGMRVSVAVSKNRYGTPEALEWSTLIFDLTTGETWEVEGFSGVFKDKNNIYAFRADGVYLVEYETEVEVLILEQSTDYIYRSIGQNEERTKLAWVSFGNEAHVYELNESPVVQLVSLFSKVGIFGTIVLTDNNLYDLAPKESGGTTIIRHGIFTGDTEQVRSLPGILSVSKLLI